MPGAGLVCVYISSHQWYSQDRDGSAPGAVCHPGFQAELLRGSLSASQPGVEKRGAGDCADCGAVPERAELPGGARDGPGIVGAEGGQGETGPLHPQTRAGQNAACGSTSLRMLGPLASLSLAPATDISRHSIPVHCCLEQSKSSKEANNNSALFWMHYPNPLTYIISNLCTL